VESNKIFTTTEPLQDGLALHGRFLIAQNGPVGTVGPFVKARAQSGADGVGVNVNHQPHSVA
jgi:hypothetical protein